MPPTKSKSTRGSLKWRAKPSPYELLPRQDLVSVIRFVYWKPRSANRTSEETHWRRAGKAPRRHSGGDVNSAGATHGRAWGSTTARNPESITRCQRTSLTNLSALAAWHANRPAPSRRCRLCAFADRALPRCLRRHGLASGLRRATRNDARPAWKCR